MSLLSQLKTTVKKSPAKPAVAAIEPPTPATSESVPTSPADDICDLETLAGMLQQLQTRNQQYQRAIDALVAARRIVNGWDPKPEPELIWSVRREVLVAMDDRMPWRALTATTRKTWRPSRLHATRPPSKRWRHRHGSRPWSSTSRTSLLKWRAMWMRASSTRK